MDRLVIIILPLHQIPIRLIFQVLFPPLFARSFARGVVLSALWLSVVIKKIFTLVTTLFANCSPIKLASRPSVMVHVLIQLLPEEKTTPVQTGLYRRRGRVQHLACLLD